MNLPFFSSMTAIFLVRLFYQWDDARIDGGRSIRMSIACLLLLWPVAGGRFLFLLGFLLIAQTTVFLSEKFCRNIYRARSLQFFFILIAGGFFWGSGIGPSEFNAPARYFFDLVRRNNALISVFPPTGFGRFVLYFFGIIVLVNEINNLIRGILNAVRIGPPAKDARRGIDIAEYNRGKIIGIIERILIYFFTVSGNYASIGFIIAAKGIARFKELDNRNFAEYFLIGTLLSSTLSILVGYVIKNYLAYIR